MESQSKERLENTTELNFTGAKPGYEFRITKLPDNYDDFKEFFTLFIDVFDITFTLDEEKFQRFKQYADPESIQKKDNCFF